jgi:hypothetical protein
MRSFFPGAFIVLLSVLDPEPDRRLNIATAAPATASATLATEAALFSGSDIKLLFSRFSLSSFLFVLISNYLLFNRYYNNRKLIVIEGKKYIENKRVFSVTCWLLLSTADGVCCVRIEEVVFMGILSL